MTIQKVSNKSVSAHFMTHATVIYHSADFDGIFCREVARKFLPLDTVFIGWNHGDEKIPMPESEVVYILDLPLSCVENPDYIKIINIDHHKTNINFHDELRENLQGTYLIDGVAACRLAWQWFSHAKYIKNTDVTYFHASLPYKNDFINRKVKEPYSVCLVGEFDIWDYKDSNTILFQLGLKALSPEDIGFECLLDDSREEFTKIYISDICEIGQHVQNYINNENKTLMDMAGFILFWEELNFLVINAPLKNSLTFDSKDVPETKHDALMEFYWNGKKWMISLYHAKHKKDIDLSVIATKYGGGGHKGACGFSCEELPFKLKKI